MAAIALNVEEPVFESQTKIKLGSTTMSPNGGETINKYVGDFLKKEVDNYLHIHKDVAEILENKIKESERERKAMAGVTKLARERAKKRTFTTASCAIAASTSVTPRTSRRRQVPSSSPRVILPAEASPRAAT